MAETLFLLMFTTAFWLLAVAFSLRCCFKYLVRGRFDYFGEEEEEEEEEDESSV